MRPKVFVFCVIVRDRHVDDEITLHVTSASAECAVANILHTYARYAWQIKRLESLARADIRAGLYMRGGTTCDGPSIEVRSIELKGRAEEPE